MRNGRKGSGGLQKGRVAEAGTGAAVGKGRERSKKDGEGVGREGWGGVFTWVGLVVVI